MTNPPTELGLQRQRTQLGWERTAFSFMAVAVLVGLRVHQPHEQCRLYVAAAALIVAAVASRVRCSQLRGTDTAIAPAHWTIPAVGIATTALAIACGIAVSQSP